MPIKHSIDGSLVELSITGRPAVEEITAAFRAMLADIRFPAEAAILINVIDSETLPPPETMLEISALLCAQHTRTTAVAVLVAHPVRFGLARQLGSRLEACGIRARPFPVRDEALAWLGVSEGG